MEKSPLDSYHESVIQILNNISTEQRQSLLEASNILTETTLKGSIIHTFGTGHSHLVAEDVFWRGSTLANIHAILEPSLTGHEEITKAEYMEKIEGMGKVIVDYHRITSPDALIVISNSGNNAVPIDVAMECHKRGVKVIAITSFAYSDYLKTLHSSGKKLKDIADVSIDNCCPVGDSVVHFEGMDMSVGAVSTIAGCFIMHSLVAQTVKNLLDKGVKPDVYYNGSLMANREQVDVYNQQLIEKYMGRIRNL